jgi:uncharacterized membrane protein YgcG
MPLRARLGAVVVLACLAAVAWPRGASADEGWEITSFDVTYEIQENGLVEVTEDIRVDFFPFSKHGIFREMPVRYRYDDSHDRLISVANVEVDNGSEPWQFELIESDANLRIKIGDPDVLVEGEQRYRIRYLLTGALNPFDDHDEFFWNVTGEWPVRIEQATAEVVLPDGGILDTECFQGPEGSTEACADAFSGDLAEFGSTRTLPEAEQMTIVVGLEKGAVEVAPPVLVEPLKEGWEKFKDDVSDAFEISPLTVGTTLALFALGMVATVRQWWIQGRDKWYGEVWYANDGTNPLEKRKPMFAREAVIVEYEPPPMERNGRPLRPAEIGTLLDEKADTKDVTATIIDLAVRKYIRITETKSGGFLGLFKSTDYEIERLRDDEGELLAYEQKTMNGLFKGSAKTVKMSSLKNKFYKDLEKIKEAIYDQMVKKDKLFPRSPSTTRTIYLVAGAVLIGAGIGLGYLLTYIGWGLAAIPVVVIGIIVLAMAPLMPRRTGKGRLLYQRSVGFRRFMVTAETDRQRFAERANIFHEYLPYAIVYDCVEKWAEAFEGLADIEQPDWYVGTRPFVLASFMDSVNSFSSSVSSTVASTPGGSGGSGFGGGGSSGGGGGGGGGGSW